VGWLRAIGQGLALGKVQKLLGLDGRYSLGWLSEAARVFDAHSVLFADGGQGR
jgi:hypothetical protein